MKLLAGIVLGMLVLALSQLGTWAKPVSQNDPNQTIRASFPWQKPLLHGPTYSMRELAWKADLILRVEPGPLNSWKVQEVVHGDLVTLVPPSPMPDTYPKLARDWIGFWRSTPKGFELLPTGIRARNAEGQVWIPGQGEIRLEYSQMVDDLKLDLKSFIVLKTDWVLNDPILRNQKLWRWALDRANQFGGGITHAGSMGWGSVEQDLLMEVLFGPEDSTAWDALNLYSRTNSDELPPLKRMFDSTSRRELLLLKANRAALSGERVRAIRVLGSQYTWQSGSTEGQWVKLNALLTTTINSPTPELSKATIGALKMLATLGKLELALSELAWNRYLEMAPGLDRAHWAAQLARILGPELWKQRTGNGAGMVVVFEKLAWSENQISWTLSRLGGQGGAQSINLLREKLDEKGMVIETQSLPLVGKEPNLWDPAKPILGEWLVSTWPSGLWRIRAESKTSPEWKSEPRLLQVSKPLKLPGITPPVLGTVKVVIDPPHPKGK